MFNPKRLDLHLPTTWNSCTTQQLETIAAVLLSQALTETPYKPFDLLQCKTQLFFALTDIEIWQDANPSVPVEEQYYVCSCHGEIFNLYLWQIEYWLGEGEVILADNRKVRKQHLLGFIEGPNKHYDGLTLFPYQEIKRGFWRKKFRGPEMLMQNFSWQQYRFAQDWLDYHTRASNIFLNMLKNRIKYSDEDIMKAAKQVDLARSSFLATIFNAKVKGVDEQSQQIYKDYEYRSNQHSDNVKYFRNFDPIKFQVIMFWWQGMMYYLQKKYPNVFKSDSPDKNVGGDNPLEVYVRTSATLEKYLGMTEKEINNQLFHVVLQHIDDMIKENKELEKSRTQK